jgi:hypothetical protein
MLSEFRSLEGELRGFEVGHEYVTFNALCNALAQMSGVSFEERTDSLWSVRPRRFMFRGRLFEVSIPSADIWIGPVEPEVAYPETEELLMYVKRNVLSRTRLRIRSRYYGD